MLAEDNHRIDNAERRPGLPARLRAGGAAQRRDRPVRWRACSRTRSRACSAARWRTTTSTGWCWRRWRPRGRGAARLRSTLAGRLRAVAGHHRRDAGGTIRASRACWCRCSGCASIPQAGCPGRVAGERAYQALDKVSNLSEDRVLRQLLALLQATLRTNPGAPASAPVAHRAAPSFLSLGSTTRCPGCRDASAVRDLGVRRASRASTCAAARWPRRPALVGPAGRFPHRGAGPGEGADGEEHRHRAGRFQGRLRPEEGAAGQRSRGLP